MKKLLPILTAIFVFVSGCGSEKKETPKPTISQPAVPAENLAEQQAAFEKEQLEQWTKIIPEIKAVLAQIDETIKMVQTGKQSPLEAIKPLINLRKQMLNIHQKTTLLHTLDNQTLIQARQIYYNETNKIWKSIETVQDWLNNVASGKLNKTDDANIKQYRNDIINSLNKLTETELTVKKFNSPK